MTLVALVLLCIFSSLCGLSWWLLRGRTDCNALSHSLIHNAGIRDPYGCNIFQNRPDGVLVTLSGRFLLCQDKETKPLTCTNRECDINHTPDFALFWPVECLYRTTTFTLARAQMCCGTVY